MAEPVTMHGDAIQACADLVGRAGAREFNIGYLDDDPGKPDWYAYAQYQGTRVISEGHRTPTAAAMDLAERLLKGARCRCGRMVTLSDGVDGCRWTLAGKRWEPGCDAPSVKVTSGPRGDLAAMHAAMEARRAGTS